MDKTLYYSFTEVQEENHTKIISSKTGDSGKLSDTKENDNKKLYTCKGVDVFSYFSQRNKKRREHSAQ